MDKHNSEYELGRQTESMDKSRGVDDVLGNIYIQGYEYGHNDTVESCYGNYEEKATEYIEESKAKTELYNIFKREIEREKVGTKCTMGGIACGGEYVNWEETDYRAVQFNAGIDKADQVLKRLLKGGV